MNTRSALKKYTVDRCNAWTDSTIILFWLKTRQGYEEFVTNRVLKIRKKNNIEWRYVPTQQNPANIGSRGCKGNKIQELWARGPSWVDQSKIWTDIIEISAEWVIWSTKQSNKRNHKGTLKISRSLSWKFSSYLLVKFVNVCKK